jgi:sugar lactone lactonase YvrE
MSLYFPSFKIPSFKRGVFLFAAAAPIVLVTGCANLVPTAVESNAVDGSTVISGVVHGGRQPVVGAAVTLWAAGNAGYGSAATSLATATTDGNGDFSFHSSGGPNYTCPSMSSSTASQYLYITASGGQPTAGVTNSASALMAALGNCSAVMAANPSVVINEVTTIASMFALQQFFAPSGGGLGSFGTSPTNLTGLANAMATVNNLVNIGSGTAYSSTTASGAVSGYSTNPSVTITPEQSKIDTLANILAACVNSTGASSSTCSPLFSGVSSATVQDTLQAAYYLATNPTSTVSGTSNISAGNDIFGIAVANSPFQPSLSAAPSDWTIGVTYGSNSSQTISSTTVYLLTEPSYVGVDSNGNVWVANFKTTNSATLGNSATELSPVGVPMTQVFTAVNTISSPKDLVIDPSDNVWVAGYGTGGIGKKLSEYTTGGTTKTFSLSVEGPDGLASDGSGNIYVADYSGTAGSGDIELIPAGSVPPITPTKIASNVSVGSNSNLAIDGYGDLWLSNNTGTAITQFICTYSGTPSLPTSCSATSTTVGGAAGAQAIAVANGNNIFVGDYSATAGDGAVSEIAATNSSTITGVGGSPFSGGGLQNPVFSIVDGLGNYWATNFATNAGSVSELTSAGVAVSPSSGYSHTYAGAEGIAIDGSGNVWIGNSSNNAASSGTVKGFITEIVGAAAPVVTPLAAGLPTTFGGAGSNTLGTRP